MSTMGRTIDELDDKVFEQRKRIEELENVLLQPAAIATHILRNWKREKIEKFALHLLGDDAQKQMAQVNRECVWTFDDTYDCEKWDTACGTAYSYDNGLSPQENEVNFCSYCGGKVVVKEKDIEVKP